MIFLYLRIAFKALTLKFPFVCFRFSILSYLSYAMVYVMFQFSFLDVTFYTVI